MTLDDDVRRCCESVDEEVRRAERLRSCCDEAQRDLDAVDRKLSHFAKEAKEARAKLNAGVREGLERLVESWREAYDRIHAHLLLIEAKSFLLSAQRLAREEDFVAAENELAQAIRDCREAQQLLPERSRALERVVADIERVVQEIRDKATASEANIQHAVERTTEVLKELQRAA